MEADKYVTFPCVNTYIRNFTRVDRNLRGYYPQVLPAIIARRIRCPFGRLKLEYSFGALTRAIHAKCFLGDLSKLL